MRFDRELEELLGQWVLVILEEPDLILEITRQAWVVSDEGPWSTEEDARDFLDLEVGVPAFVAFVPRPEE